MKYCVIHGSPRKGNTYHVTELLKKELDKFEKNTYTEFFLPQDMPHFCLGCFTCFIKGEDNCPHFKYVSPILKALKEADGLIFTSPVYVLSATAQMKALLDHLGYIFIVHRPVPEMFNKTAMIISTTAGAGTKKVVNLISSNLSYWGVKKIDSLRFNMFALKWNDIKESKRAKFERTIRLKAGYFNKDTKNRFKMRGPIKRFFIYKFVKKLINSYDNDSLDKKYWQEQGWLNGKNPFKYL